MPPADTNAFNFANQFTEVISELSLYGNWNTAQECIKFFGKLAQSHSLIDSDFRTPMEEYDRIVLKMRDEIGIPK